MQLKVTTREGTAPETDDYADDHAAVVLFNNIPDVKTITLTFHDGSIMEYAVAD